MADYFRLDVPKLGTLIVWCNGTSREDRTRYQVGIRTEWMHNRYAHSAPAGGWDGVADVVTINGVEYSVSDFVSVAADGSDPQETRYSGNALTRKDWSAVRDMHGSPAAVKRYRALVMPALAEWLATQDGQAFLADGERARIADDLARLNRERADVVARLAEIDAAIRELVEQ